MAQINLGVVEGTRLDLVTETQYSFLSASTDWHGSTYARIPNSLIPIQEDEWLTLT